jgi:hypothetical protein
VVHSGRADHTYPVRIFVTLIHEGGHALMTVLTGGRVVGMGIMPNGSGVTLSQGGWQFPVYMAGYLGAVAFGAFCLQLGRKPQSGKNGLVLLAAIVLIVTGLWLRPIGEGAFGFWMGLAVGVGLLVAARYVSPTTAAFLTSFLAVQLCLNALFDLRDLVWLTTNTNAPNDAVFMAREYGLFPWFWALMWAGCSLVILGIALRAYWKGSR